MKSSLFVTILLASALGGSCFAQGAPAPAPTGAAAAAPPTASVHKAGYDPNVQICKWTEEIGTRLGRTKTCMTRAQWDELRRSSQDQLNETLQRGAEGAPPGG